MFKACKTSVTIIYKFSIKPKNLYTVWDSYSLSNVRGNISENVANGGTFWKDGAFVLKVEKMC